MKKIFLLSSLAALLIATGCNSGKSSTEIQTRLLVTSPLQKDTTIVKDYVCQIRSIRHIELRALERGYLQEIFVDEGQHVKKGQRMFQIMPLIYNAELQKVQAEAHLAEIELQTTKSLADKNVVSKSELAMARAKYEKAKAEVSLARVHLGFTKIDAPFDGIMDRFQVRLGSLVEEGDLLTTLSDNSEMWVYFNVPEPEYLEFQQNASKENGMSVDLMMANNELFSHKGIVETIEADFNNETGTIAFRATFPNPEGLLRHGETGNIQMTAPLKNALIIPQKATYEVLDKKYVFVVDKNNVVHSREITIGADMPDLYVVAKGLKKGEKILLEGIRKVHDGQKITYKYEKPSKVISHLKVYVE
jgi:membrane fusion protein, multidrug efflux system